MVLLYDSHYLTSVICLHTVGSIWPIDRILSGATTLGQSEPGSYGNEEVLHILQSLRTRILISDGLVSYPGHSLRRVLTFCRDAVSVFYGPRGLSWYMFKIYLDYVDYLGRSDNKMFFVLKCKKQTILCVIYDRRCLRRWSRAICNRIPTASPRASSQRHWTIQERNKRVHVF